MMLLRKELHIYFTHHANNPRFLKSSDKGSQNENDSFQQPATLERDSWPFLFKFSKVSRIGGLFVKHYSRPNSVYGLHGLDPRVNWTSYKAECLIKAAHLRHHSKNIGLIMCRNYKNRTYIIYMINPMVHFMVKFGLNIGKNVCECLGLHKY